MRLSKDQIEVASDYLSDTSKILAASVVVGFFVPTQNGPVSISAFLIGLVVALLFVITAIAIRK